jgi:hypothetical protein
VSFEDDLKAQAEAEHPSADVDVTLNGKLYTFRFRRMDGDEWANEVDKHPARPGVLVDMRYGYNLRSIVKAVAPRCGVRVDGDSEESLDADQWLQLFKVLDGAGVARFGDAIWGLNEFAPAAEVEAAKKALRSTATA